ncbi:MAG: methyltransferase domain-containing protein [Nanoarchaeota archaeon]
MVKSGFFEGQDFEKEFKALIPKFYPVKYKKYISQETKLLKQKLKGSNKILEAGVGIGRLILELSPLVKEFVGVDNAELMLQKAKVVAKKFSNVNLVKCDLESLSKKFKRNYFDYSLCVWNTLGNVKDEIKVLKEISYVTKNSIFITVYLKGTIENRKSWYKIVGIKIKKIDEKNEIFYSESGLKSKSYGLNDIKRMANLSGLKIKSSKILAGVILWIELVQR